MTVVWTLTIIMVIVVILVVTFGGNIIKAATTKELKQVDFEEEEETSNEDGFVEQAYDIDLKQGFDINLEGAAERPGLLEELETIRTSTYALKPKDFIGMIPIPKVIPDEGTHVKAGDPLFYDKKRPDIIYAAPVSGEFIEIRRAEKRSIAELVILADKGDFQYRNYDLPNLETASREELVEFLLGSGAWPFIRQRPFDIVADHTEKPKAIFVSTFDTAPLAADMNLVVQGKEAEFQKGLDVLKRLAPNVHLGLDGRKEEEDLSKAFTQAKGVHRHTFKGKHPAGNVGIHIHHVDPVNTGEAVWYLNVQGVIILGTLFSKGIFDTEQLVALTGAETPNPRYAKVHQGVNLAPFFENTTYRKKDTIMTPDGEKEIDRRLVRILSGNVLTGTIVEKDGFLGFFDTQVTTVKEGDYHELFGWLLPQKGHPTRSRTFPNGFLPSATYEADTNTNGEKRAFVMTGEYESVLPMDIYPLQLMRAIQANDFERMQGLGLLELGEEDIAICEYVCTSKQPLQQILREGLDMMREQS